MTSFPARKFPRRWFTAFFFLAVFGGALPRASATRMTPTRFVGVVQSIDYKTKTVVFHPGADGKSIQLSWYWDTTFLADGKRVRADALKVGMTVKVDYHQPIFGREYMSRVVWSSTTDQPAR